MYTGSSVWEQPDVAVMREAIANPTVEAELGAMSVNLLAQGTLRLLRTVQQTGSQHLLVAGSENSYVLSTVPEPVVWQPERHVHYELAYVDAGSCTLVVAGRAYRMHPGDLCLIAPGEMHYETPEEPAANYTLFWISDSNGYLVLHATQYMGSERPLKKVVQNICMNIGSDPNSLFTVIAAEAGADRRQWYSAEVLGGYLVVLAGLICRQVRALAYKTHEVLNHSDPIVHAVADFINKNFNRPDLTVSAIAAHVGLSPKYLIEYFRKRGGVSPYHYLLQVRMERARQLLVNTDWSVTSVAYESGFASPYHFSSTFKRFHGIAPTTFRATTRATVHSSLGNP